MSHHAKTDDSTSPLVCTVTPPHGQVIARIVMPRDLPPSIVLISTRQAPGEPLAVASHVLTAEQAARLGQALTEYAEHLHSDARGRAWTRGQVQALPVAIIKHTSEPNIEP